MPSRPKLSSVDVQDGDRARAISSAAAATTAGVVDLLKSLGTSQTGTPKTNVTDLFSDAANAQSAPTDPTESGQALVASVVARYAASASQVDEHAGASLTV